MSHLCHSRFSMCLASQDFLPAADECRHEPRFRRVAPHPRIPAGPSRRAGREAESASLRRELESLRNQPPRPAAPFRIKEHKRQSNPKRPGRKPGHEGSCRQAPEVTETVTVPLEECPHCGGTVDDIQKVEQGIEEIPPVQLRVIGLTTFQGRCGCCGEVRSTHPLSKFPLPLGPPGLIRVPTPFH